MRCIGKGAEYAVMFCGIMNLPPPPTKFTKFNNILLQAARDTYEESMTEAVREAVEENDGGRDIVVDGSWQKRGFSSKNGVVTATSVDTVYIILSHSSPDPTSVRVMANSTRAIVYEKKLNRKPLSEEVVIIAPRLFPIH
ncbi:uncharacterized protein NPIL_658771 [Nephila pilipes]|uniref:Mutator-like transposase domain-containing protein n=1 Tax=Nephila pilipes TaxID=299642 RepID=A0A8X6QK82_NEPPI|nr:uncharacterized protein NPIL_658771 [Nephila pilipes]